MKTKTGRSFENQGRKLRIKGGQVQRTLAGCLLLFFLKAYQATFLSFYQAMGIIEPSN